jgi:outer membrane lipoprotein carrier protein
MASQERGVAQKQPGSLHGRPPIYVLDNVSRVALWVCLLSLPLSAADADLTRVLKGIEQRYNRTKTLKVLFTETYTVQGRARKSESGELTLRKPGRMRWDYTTPSGKLFVSDGHDLYLYTPDNNRVEKTPVKQSEDMRAPLAFLLGKLDFSKEFRDFSMKSQGSDLQITAQAKTDRLPYANVEMLVSPDYSIRKLVITDQDHSILTFVFEQERLNPAVDDSQFRFHMPAGATLVNPEAGH